MSSVVSFVICRANQSAKEIVKKKAVKTLLKEIKYKKRRFILSALR
jgi:hypothetical protein